MGRSSAPRTIARMSQRSTCLRAPLALGLGLLLSLLSGCGGERDERPEPSPAAPEQAPEVVPPAPGSPPKGPDVGTSELLTRLLRSVALGPALATEEFNQDVAHLRELLWPDLAVAGAEPAALNHVRASHVAGSIASALLADPGARTRLAKDDAFGLALHDAWIQAAQGGPEAYRTWCAGPAGGLFEQREQDLQKLFERPLR